MKIHPCFPSLIWEREVSVPHDLANYCENLSQTSVGVKGSNICGSWHSIYNLHEDNYFKNSYLNNFLNHLDFLPNFKVDACWINVNPKGSFNLQHMHPGSDLSLVWYIQTPKNCGNIEFENPHLCLRSNLMEFLDEDFVEEHYANDHQVFPSVQNKCYIFPSDLPHLVQENKSDTLRISMSANLSFFI